jgi:hypothetical protein
MQSPSDCIGTRNQEAALIERLADDKNNSHDLLWTSLRLLIDEIVDELPQTGGVCESRLVQKSIPSMATAVVLG